MWFIEIARAAISTSLDPALLFLPKDAATSIGGERSGESPVRNSFEAGQTIITVITSARTGLSTVMLAEEMQVAKPPTCAWTSSPRSTIIPFPKAAARSARVSACRKLRQGEPFRDSHRRPEDFKSYNKQMWSSAGLD
jgi:hypothetical protein